MHEGERPAIPGGVQRRRRLGQMLADDGRVADLPVAAGQLVVRESYGARVARTLAVLERARRNSDRPGPIPACEGDRSVQPPERRQERRLGALARFVGRPPEGAGGRCEVVPKQIGLDQGCPQAKFIFAADGSQLQRLRQEAYRLAAVPPLERLESLWKRGLTGQIGHGGSIPRIQPLVSTKCRTVKPAREVGGLATACDLVGENLVHEPCREQVRSHQTRDGTQLDEVTRDNAAAGEEPPQQSEQLVPG